MKDEAWTEETANAVRAKKRQLFAMSMVGMIALTFGSDTETCDCYGGKTSRARAYIGFYTLQGKFQLEGSFWFLTQNSVCVFLIYVQSVLKPIDLI